MALFESGLRTGTNMDTFFKDAVKSVPTSFKILWVLGAAASFAFTGVIIWAIVKVVGKFVG